MADIPDPAALAEAVVAALAADDRVLSGAERQLLRAIAAQAVERHGPAAGESVMDAAAQLIGQRLMGQLGRAVAERALDRRPEPEQTYAKADVHMFKPPEPPIFEPSPPPFFPPASPPFVPPPPPFVPSPPFFPPFSSLGPPPSESEPEPGPPPDEEPPPLFDPLEVLTAESAVLDELFTEAELAELREWALARKRSFANETVVSPAPDAPGMVERSF
ncbi:hypothetical protein ABT084_11320 [Streptomyces sp. NPDC002138]|uniref:hypothetical protein n=1 Tax=Streptomyces sp. NPDC002138 TaxID=3154410 RepID=UPI003333E151